MTFEELEAKLPNGFHDAEIASIHWDYVSRTVDLSMNLLVGVGTPSNPNKSLYRPGTVRISGLLLFYFEPPDPNYNFIPRGKPLDVSGDCVRAGQSAQADRLLAVLPKTATAYRFFLEEWNSFIYLAGASAEFSWADGSGPVEHP